MDTDTNTTGAVNQALEDAAQVCESGEVFGEERFVKFVNAFKAEQAKRIRAMKS